MACTIKRKKHRERQESKKAGGGMENALGSQYLDLCSIPKKDGMKMISSE